MGKIFCIIGKSSTGKDTLYQRILGRHDLALRQIVSYTTRPIRAGEVDGIEYHFAHMRKKTGCWHPARSWRSAVIIPVTASGTILPLTMATLI